MALDILKARDEDGELETDAMLHRREVESMELKLEERGRACRWSPRDQHVG
jgi:hypothetical protein